MSVDAQEYLDLRVNTCRLLLIKSYVETEEHLNRDTLLNLFKAWEEES